MTVLAGLEGGTVGALWMLAWLGVSSLWRQRGFWTPENLMATAFDRNATLAPAFTWATGAGLAVYLLMYGLLGVLFAAAVGRRLPRRRIMLAAIVFSLVWYYFSFRWTFKFALPLVALLHMERPTILGHLLYGTLLGRFPAYVDRLMGVAPPAVASELPVPEAVSADPQPEAVSADAHPEGSGAPSANPPESAD